VSQPFLIYVIWHPDCSQGQEIADRIFEHFRSNVFSGVAGGAGIEVLYRYAPATDQPDDPPLAVPIGPDDCLAVVLLIDESMAKASKNAWRPYLSQIVDQAGQAKWSRVYPVALTRDAFDVPDELAEINFIRWYEWSKEPREIQERNLLQVLGHSFCRLLDQRVEWLENSVEPDVVPDPVEVFLSHAKLDGEDLALLIRQRIHSDTALRSFFDAKEIPPGYKFADVIQAGIRRSALVVLHTNEFASREWCRREVLTAKQHSVPAVVVNCVTESEERGFPYLGNVPVVRMEPANAAGRIPLVIGALLDEVLTHLYWRCRVPALRQLAPAGAVFFSRAPELLTLVTAKVALNPTPLVIYPDPPLGATESEILRSAFPTLELRTPAVLAAVT
jgi:hypothetical protein